MPQHAGLLEVSEDGECILPEQYESRHGFRLWLKLLINHLLAPGGYVLNGDITWEGEDRDDCGTIFVKDNQVEVVEDLIFNTSPSRAHHPLADDSLTQAIRAFSTRRVTPAAFPS